MALEALARTRRKPFYLKYLLAAVDALAYNFTPIRGNGGLHGQDLSLPSENVLNVQVEMSY